MPLLAFCPDSQSSLERQTGQLSRGIPISRQWSCHNFDRSEYQRHHGRGQRLFAGSLNGLTLMQPYHRNSIPWSCRYAHHCPPVVQHSMHLVVCGAFCCDRHTIRLLNAYFLRQRSDECLAQTCLLPVRCNLHSLAYQRVCAHSRLDHPSHESTR